jgi:hypothetical protein
MLAMRTLALSVESSGVENARGPSPQMVFLNRDQATYIGGPDDAPSGSSNVVAQRHIHSATFAQFTEGDDAWENLVACLTADYAPFDVLVTDKRPPAGPYVEAHFGGDGTELKLPSGTGGVAPIDSTHCTVIDSAVVFVFAGLYGSNVEAMCDAGAQEIAHAFSLDHEFLCEDPMTYLGGCGAKRFQDVDASCGEYQARGCTCDRASQNSVRTLYKKVGQAQPTSTGGLQLSIQSMKAHYPILSEVEIAATVSTLGTSVRSATLVWTDLNGTDRTLDLCPQDNRSFAANIQLGPVPGDRWFVVRVDDNSGNMALSPRLRVRVVAN